MLGTKAIDGTMDMVDLFEMKGRLEPVVASFAGYGVVLIDFCLYFWLMTADILNYGLEKHRGSYSGAVSPV